MDDFDENCIWLPDGTWCSYAEMRHDGVGLGRFHRNPKQRPQCFCRGRALEPLPIVVRLIKPDFKPAAFPNTVSLHHKKCPFYAAKPLSAPLARSVYDGAAIKEVENGFRVYLTTALSIAAEQARRSPISVADGNRSPGHKRDRIELLGLLEFIWECAKLHEVVGTGEQVNAVDYRYGLLRDRAYLAMESIHLANGTFSSRCWIPTAKSESKAIEVLANETFGSKDNFLFMVGLVKKPPVIRGGGKYWIFPLFGNEDVDLLVPISVADEAFKSYGRIPEDTTAHRWIIAKCKSPKLVDQGNGRRSAVCEATELAWMMTHPFGVPVDSSLELDVACALFQSGRTFRKPVRFANTGMGKDPKWSSSHPDFVLFTEKGEMPMEVWGMNTPEYLKKIPERVARYDGREIWQWHAYRNDPMPPFPS